jgi:hypothetical protein
MLWNLFIFLLKSSSYWYVIFNVNSWSRKFAQNWIIVSGFFYRIGYFL